jgi:hypothetical protein
VCSENRGRAPVSKHDHAERDAGSNDSNRREDAETQLDGHAHVHVVMHPDSDAEGRVMRRESRRDGRDCDEPRLAVPKPLGATT